MTATYRPATVCVLIAGTLLGCSGERGATGVCAGPECCVPLSLTAANVSVYELDGSLSVTLIVGREDTGNVDYTTWAPSAAVTTPWAGTQNCTAPLNMIATDRYSRLECPAVTPTDMPACDSSASITVQLQSSSYSLTSSSSPACQGTGLGSTSTYAVPVKCPICPSSPILVNLQPCDLPNSKNCSYMALGPGGELRPAPCYCELDTATGKTRWACAVP